MSSNTTVTTEESALEQVSLQVVASLAAGIALLIVLVVQLVYRSTIRHSRLYTVQRRLRFDPHYLVTKGGDLSERLVAEARRARKARELIMQKPPFPARRVFPTLVERLEARSECRRMLLELRTALSSTFPSASHMPMRVALQCIQDALDPQDVERFAYLYDAITLGIHRADGTIGDTTAEDLKFMKSYFGTIMKEL